MANSGQVSADTKASIEQLCSYIASDREIAEYIGCGIETVTSIRSRIPRRTRGRPPRQAEMLATKSNILDSSISASDDARALAAQQGSDALLRRQLETGQHELSADQFYAICHAKGWLSAPRARKEAA